MTQNSITLEKAKKHINKMNNESLYNFIDQRRDSESLLLEHARQVANDRLAKELAMIWKGQKLKDEPLQDIIDRKTKESQGFLNDHIEIVHIK
tara:strand:- start:350 stop:628 length:279 start_codon:yes stop_codon:yes gene_type:complete